MGDLLAGIGAVGGHAAQGDALRPGGVGHSPESLGRLGPQGAVTVPGAQSLQLRDVAGGQDMVLIHQHPQTGRIGNL